MTKEQNINVRLSKLQTKKNENLSERKNNIITLKFKQIKVNIREQVLWCNIPTLNKLHALSVSVQFTILLISTSYDLFG